MQIYARETEKSPMSVSEINNEDRVSNLPYELVLQIMCCLPSTNHAARTSILSKKWQFLWTNLPVLYVPYPPYICPKRFFTLFNRCLILNQSPVFSRFSVSLFYTKSFASDVDAWLRCAAMKNVVELDLALPNVRKHTSCESCKVSDYDERTKYSWPWNIFRCNSSLVVLRLAHIEIKHCGRLIQLKSLKFLSFAYMELSNEFLHDILSGSPSLDHLAMAACHGYDFLVFKSERLTKLTIHDHSGVTPLKISAPSLQALDLSGVLNTYKVSLIDMSSLVDARIAFSLQYRSHGIDDVRISKYPNIIEKLLGNLWNVKYLSVWDWCLQMISLLDEKTIPVSHSRLVHLKITTDFSERERPGIAKLLAMAPLLETLVFHTYHKDALPTHLETKFLKSDNLVQENYWSSQKSYFASALENLKVVKILGFLALQSEIELVLFLLQNASSLEKMIIQANAERFVSMQGCLKTSQMLLSFPRCSPHAIILFT